MGKSIKDIADELGVSKQAIRKEIANLKMQTSLRKIGNQFVINETQEKLIKSAFLNRQSQTENANQNANQSQTSLHQVDTLINMLQKELEAKNEQIAEMQKLLDQEQKLRMAEHQRVLILEQHEQDKPKKKWWQRKGEIIDG